MKTSEVLNLAADLIEQRGWTTGPDGWNDPDEFPAPLCLEGGIQAALEETGVPSLESDFRDCPAYKAVQSYLELKPTLLAPETSVTLWYWNDNKAETEERVIAVLRAAALVEATKEAKVLVAA